MDLDPAGHHALRCHGTADRIPRHNNLRDWFVSQSRIAMLQPLKEPKNLLRNCGKKPADLAIPEYRPAKLLAIDVAITDPTQEKFVARAATEQGFAAKHYGENVKVKKYSDLLERNPEIIFQPHVAETFGGWNEHAINFFNYLCTHQLQRDRSKPFPVRLNQLYQAASIILQRGNANMLLHRVNARRFFATNAA